MRKIRNWLSSEIPASVQLVRKNCNIAHRLQKFECFEYDNNA